MARVPRGSRPLETNIGSKIGVQIGLTALSKNSKTYTWRGFLEAHAQFRVESFWGNPRGSNVPPPPLGGTFGPRTRRTPVVKHKIQREKPPQRGVGEEAGRKGFRLKTEK